MNDKADSMSFNYFSLGKKASHFFKTMNAGGGGATNVTYQQHKVGRELRARILGSHSGFRGCTLWFTGLSGAGKTTISFALERTLCDLGLPAYGLDGDNMRHGVCADLGFSPENRAENIRRVAEVSKLFADMGVICLSSFISPYQKDRNHARQVHEEAELAFIEIFVDTPLDVCESRDTKGLYAKARQGKITGFTGIDSSYETPVNPDLTVYAGRDTEAVCVEAVLQFLYQKKILPEKAMQQLCGVSPVRELMLTDDNEQLKLTAANSLPRLDITDIDLQWLQVLSEGWASPLYGFMRERQYLQCLHNGLLLDLKTKCTEPGLLCQNSPSIEDQKNKNHLFDPINQSIPIVLPIDSVARDRLLDAKGKVLNKISLWHNNKPVATINDPEIYAHQKEERVCRQFGTNDARHPTVKMILQSGDWLLGGDIQCFDRILFNDGLDQYRLSPNELREKFIEMKADAVFVFQLRNPIHNGHALLMRDTREQLLKKHKNPVLLLHPLGGWTKDDDVPLKVRMAQHHAVLEEGVLDPAWTLLAIFPSPMLYAGPTEVQWHARARLAAGVQTYIVGRDPAGIQKPGSAADYLYDPTHGAKVLSMAPGLANLNIVPFRVAAYDNSTNQMAFYDESRKDDFLFISGTKMRSYARNGQQPPPGFMAPKAWQVLAAYYQDLAAESNNSN